MAFDPPKPDIRRPKGKTLLSPARGKSPEGLDAHSLRDYAPGDDYRQIDWTWCARRDEILTKVRPPHRQDSLFVLLDCSRSMAAAPAKFELARRIAAIVGDDALRHEQAVSAAAFSCRIDALFPFGWGAAGAARLMRFLASLECQGGDTRLAAAADALARSTPRRGPVLLISDLLDRNGFEQGINALLRCGFEPLLVQPIVGDDSAAPGLGEVELVDVESGRPLRVILTQQAADAFRARVAAFYQAVRDYCRTRRLVCLQPPHDAKAEEVVRQLSAAAAHHARRARHGGLP